MLHLLPEHLRSSQTVKSVKEPSTIKAASTGGVPRRSDGCQEYPRRSDWPTGSAWRSWSSCRPETPGPSLTKDPQGRSQRLTSSCHTSPDTTPTRSRTCHTAPRHWALSQPPGGSRSQVEDIEYCSSTTQWHPGSDHTRITIPLCPHCKTQSCFPPLPHTPTAPPSAGCMSPHLVCSFRQRTPAHRTRKLFPQGMWGTRKYTTSVCCM